MRMGKCCGRVLIFLGALVPAPGLPLRQGEALHGAEDPVLQVRVGGGKGVNKVLDLLTLGVLVRGTDVVDHGQIHAVGKVADGLLRQVQHGPDLGNAGFVQVGHGLKAADAALKQQGHKEGLHGIVVVVAQGDLVAAPVQKGLVQGAPAHFGAHGAGVLLMAMVEDDGTDLRVNGGVGDIQPAAQLRHRGKIHAGKAHVDGDGLQGEGAGMVLPEPGQQGQKGQRILAARHADGDLIAGGDHMIVLHAAADQTHEFLQFLSLIYS